MGIQNVIEFFKKLFPTSKPKTTDEEQNRNKNFTIGYENIKEINITALVAGKLANIVTTDGEINVVGDGARAKFLDETLKACTSNLRNIVSRELGVGGVILKPAVVNGKIYTDIIGQDRFIDVEQKGSDITKAGFIADTFERDSKTYTRVEYHVLEYNGVYTIEQKGSVDGKEIPLNSVMEWAELKPVVQITGVKQMLFSFVKCPVDNRKQFSNVYGVPITYGQDKLISEIVQLLKEMQKEFINKSVFIGIDNTLFNGENKLPTNGIYKTFNSNVDNFWEVFSPDIRYEAYIEAINYKLELLEKAIGVSKGVLTNLETSNATATEIRRSTFDTFAVVGSVRDGLEDVIKGLVYAYDVIANVNNLTPKGGYTITFDWSYGLLEDSNETFNQFVTAVGAGWAKPEEARAWHMNEDIKTAKKNLPKTEQLLKAE